MRSHIGTFVRHALLWALLIAGVASAYGLWESSGWSMVGVQQSATGEAIELTRGRDGQFQLTLEITGAGGSAPQPIRFIIDTGASDIVLTMADAQKLGFRPADLAFLGTARTANGVTRTAMVWLDRVRIGEVDQRRVRALVNEGELHVSLLGMAYLSRFSRIEMQGNRLRLEF